MSIWPSTASIATLNVAAFLSKKTIDVTIVSPTDGQTVTTSELEVQWSFAPGTQSTYRVRVFASDGVALVHDSGVVASATQTYTVPDGTLTTATDYEVQVDITTTLGQTGASPQHTVTMSFAPSVNISGLTVTPVPAGTPPHNQIDWTQVVPGGGETFIRYNVYYRKTGTTDWTRIKAIDAIATVQYLHYEVPSLNSYDYAVTWTATDASGNVLESVKSAEADTLSFNDGWLHNTDDVTEYAQIPGMPTAVFTPTQAIEMRRARGRLQPSAFISELEATQLTWNVKPQLHSSRDVWDDLKVLQTAQREEAAVLCMRSGHSGDRIFVQITELSRTDGQGTYSISIAMQQVFYNEAE